MGLFDGIAKASSTQGRRPWISRPGVTLVKLDRVGAGENQDKLPFVHFDMTVLHTMSRMGVGKKVLEYNAKQEANDAPEKAVAITPHEKGDLVAHRVAVKSGKMKDTYISNIKNMCESAFEELGIDSSEWEDGDWDSAIFDKEEGIASGDGTLTAGTLLVVQTEARIGKDSGNPYFVNTYSPGGEVAAELVKEGTLDASILGEDDEE